MTVCAVNKLQRTQYEEILSIFCPFKPMSQQFVTIHGRIFPSVGFGAIDSIINMIDMNRLLGVYESDSAMLEWLHARGYDNFAPMGHPREDGHVLWAGHVSNRIKELL